MIRSLLCIKTSYPIEPVYSFIRISKPDDRHIFLKDSHISSLGKQSNGYTMNYKNNSAFTISGVAFMFRKKCVVAIFLATFFYTNAQERWGVTFRPQLNFPVTSFMDKDLRVGNGLELEATYDLMPHLTLYGGVHWNQMDTDERFDEDHIDFNQGGYIFGTRLRLPFNKSKVGYYVSAGTIYSRTRITSDISLNNQKTDFLLNWQLGTGILVPIFKYWVFTAELRYRFFQNTVIQIDTTDQVLNLDTITISSGITYRF